MHLAPPSCVNYDCKKKKNHDGDAQCLPPPPPPPLLFVASLFTPHPSLYVELLFQLTLMTSFGNHPAELSDSDRSLTAAVRAAASRR